jgi:hypothetical protein
MKPTDSGLRNRTGAKASPIDSSKTAEGAVLGTPDDLVSTEAFELQSERLLYANQALPVGTMPPPASVKGAAKTAVKMVSGKHPNVFLDQLAARLAFERTGTRIYEALLVKHEAASVHEGGPTHEELVHIRDEELAHAMLLIACIEELGADPTAVTPAADIQAVASCGIVQVLGDPRTTLTQALQAVLVAELADVDSWQVLIDMADVLGHADMVDRFQAALDTEEEHLLKVRSWVSAALLGQAGAATEPEEDEEDEEVTAIPELHPPPTGKIGR